MRITARRFGAEMADAIVVANSKTLIVVALLVLLRAPTQSYPILLLLPCCAHRRR